MAGDDWSREEVEATVGDYFSMLRDELAGLRVNKAEHNERLRRLLRSRSKGSVEFKHANISAVLTLHGYPYIDGYKPRLNFQALLEPGFPPGLQNYWKSNFLQPVRRLGRSVRWHQRRSRRADRRSSHHHRSKWSSRRLPASDSR